MLLTQPLFLPEGLPRREQVDAEPFCRWIFRRSRLEFSYHDEEEAISFLIEECWQLSLGYQHGINAKCFSNYATGLLKHRLTDWQRKRFGRTKWQFADRTYERPRPVHIPLDDRPDTTDPSLELDASVYSLADLLGLQRERDRGVSPAVDGMGKAPSREAA